MRSAKPLLLVSTPIGGLFGVIEAWRVGAWLGTLMLVLIGVIAGFALLTVRVICADRNRSEQRPGR